MSSVVRTRLGAHSINCKSGGIPEYDHLVRNTNIKSFLTDLHTFLTANDRRISLQIKTSPLECYPLSFESVTSLDTDCFMITFLVTNLNSLSIHCSDNISRFESTSRWHILTQWHESCDIDWHFKPCYGFKSRTDRSGSTHVTFHPSHPSCRFDTDTATLRNKQLILSTK